ncbi:MAG: hypothetical protein ACQEVA_08645 [Myxococcota bacterium]
MEVSIEDLVEAGFPRDAWPEDIPEPDTDNITGSSIEGSEELYRYEIEKDGTSYAMEVVLDTATVPNPAEGVVFMLNQFAYLWRTDKGQIEVGDDGSCRRINF